MKKVICVLLCILTLVGCSSSESEPNEIIIENVKQEAVDQIYYYYQLNDADKYYYDLLLEASKGFAKTIKGEKAFDKDSFERALYAFTYDYPLYFWWRGEVSTSITGNTFKTTSNNTVNNIEETVNSLLEIKDDILNECKNDNNYQYVKNIHDYLVNNINYIDTDNCHNIAGSLLNNSAVCDGYTLAYKYLLNEAGFNCIGADGDALENGVLVHHAWNYVQLNNKWYQVDCTWDDAMYEGELNTKLIYDYFLLSDSMMNMDHFVKEGYAYPTCDDDSMFYVNMSGAYIKEYSEDVITDYVKKWINSGYQDIYIKFMNFEDGLSAYKWILEEQGFVDIYKKTNKNYDITYGGDYNNNSHVLHLFYKES